MAWISEQKKKNKDAPKTLQKLFMYVKSYRINPKGFSKSRSLFKA